MILRKYFLNPFFRCACIADVGGGFWNMRWQIARWNNTRFQQLLLWRIIGQLIFQRVIIAAKMIGTNACGIRIKCVLSGTPLYPLAAYSCIFWKFKKIPHHFTGFLGFLVVILAPEHSTIYHFTRTCPSGLPVFFYCNQMKNALLTLPNRSTSYVKRNIYHR